jgi:hypothetical protein
VIAGEDTIAIKLKNLSQNTQLSSLRVATIRIEAVHLLFGQVLEHLINKLSQNGHWQSFSSLSKSKFTPAAHPCRILPLAAFS